MNNGDMPFNIAGGGMETLTVDSADKRYVNESGDRINGGLDVNDNILMNNNQIKNLGDPIDSGDAVNIKYFTSSLAPALALALAPYNTLMTELRSTLDTLSSTVGTLRTKQIKNEAAIVKLVGDSEKIRSDCERTRSDLEKIKVTSNEKPLALLKEEYKGAIKKIDELEASILEIKNKNKGWDGGTIDKKTPDSKYKIVKKY